MYKTLEQSFWETILIATVLSLILALTSTDKSFAAQTTP